MATMKCVKCGGDFVPADWWEEEIETCSSCIAIAEERRKRREAAAKAAAQAEKAARAKLPSPVIIGDYREDRSRPVREWGQDRDGRWHPPMIGRVVGTREPVTVDGFTFEVEAVFDTDYGLHRSDGTSYRWKRVASPVFD
jgi:hypothetical protein